MTSEFDPAVELTTDRLFSCVSDVLSAVGITDKLASRAVLIYECIDPEGERQIDFVTTRDLASTDIVGMAHFVREASIMGLLYPEE
jgi:hypothetical protein